MILDNKPLEHLTADDIRNLMTDQVSEGERIEYKRDLPGNTDGAKKEFLADVSSFANTHGGYLIFGIEEHGGVPTGIPGIQIDNPDETVLRMENIIRNGITPRILANTRCISISNTESVVVVKISQSIQFPHMVTFQEHYKLYERGSAGKYPMDVHQLRRAFKRSEIGLERVQTFRDERLARIAAGTSSAHTLPDGAKIILHLIPYSVAIETTQYDVNELRRQLIHLRPLYNHGGYTDRITVDGIETVDQTESPVQSYLKIFRNGAIEAVNTSILYPWTGRLQIPSEEFERQLIDGVRRYLSVLQQIGAYPPIEIRLTMTGMDGYHMGVDARQIGSTGFLRIMMGESTGIDRDVLEIPEVVVNDYSDSVETIMKPIFDSVWNAAGWQGSMNYNQDGTWKYRL